MARVKAVFDADILIHLIKVGAIDFAIETLGVLYVSDYVYENEIKNTTVEGKKIEKLKNNNNIKVLEYTNLTGRQKKVYNETYKLLKKEDVKENEQENPINEGERVTACFAKACNIYYYMSDDNKASSHIKSLAAVDIVNFCDILFLYLITFGKERKNELAQCYEDFIKLYDSDKIPRILKHRGIIYKFEEMMAVSYDKFNKNINLKSLLTNVKENVSANKCTAVDEVDKDEE